MENKTGGVLVGYLVLSVSMSQEKKSMTATTSPDSNLRNL